MATMASFDITSTLDLQEVDNAINQARKEIAQRYDFKGSKSAIDFDRTEGTLTLVADDDFKMRALWEVIETRLVRRKVPVQQPIGDDHASPGHAGIPSHRFECRAHRLTEATVSARHEGRFGRLKVFRRNAGGHGRTSLGTSTLPSNITMTLAEGFLASAASRALCGMPGAIIP